ncbi:MAG: hypothetical protein KDD42_10270 [Bdellovibrionales bacterium]|nr:hypothetical protein [Bdellovibrionales bacterium]
MDTSKALNSLLEAADLTRMVEQLTAPGSTESFQSSVAGMRITLRNIRNTILASHSILAKERVESARANSSDSQLERMAEPGSVVRPNLNSVSENPLIREAISGSARPASALRNSVERVTERS